MQQVKLIIISLFVLSNIQAQMLYHPIKLEMGMSMGELSKHNAGFITPYAELKLNLDNHFTLGGRLEYVYFSQKDNPYTNTNSSNQGSDKYWNNIESDGSILSASGTINYYLNTHKLRPFIGIGLGLHRAILTEKNIFINKDENLIIPGALSRIGINYDHFIFSIEYNYLPNDVTSLNYLSIKIGYEIGGGKKLFVKP